MALVVAASEDVVLDLEPSITRENERRVANRSIGCRRQQERASPVDDSGAAGEVERVVLASTIL